ncbi:MAG: ABC transporter substrate-binding protein [Chloroflexota bacterium]
MATTWAIAASAAVILVAPLPAGAQHQADKVARIGVLVGATLSDPLIDGLRQGLRELGHIEGQNLHIEWRSVEGKDERLPGFADELVKLKVEVIVTLASPAALAAKQATATIPIVFTLVSDAVGQGLVSSLARPDGNVTGVSGLRGELAGKGLEVLKEAAPSLTSVTLLTGPRNLGSALTLTQAQIAARRLGLDTQIVEIDDPGKLGTSFTSFARGHIHGVFLVSGPFLFTHRVPIAELAKNGRNPLVGWHKGLTESGALLSYGASNFDMGRRAAAYVAKLLSGAKPSDLPVEQPTKFELVINIRTAKAIGLTIPRSLLLRADQIVE